MEQAGIRRVKTYLSEYLRRVRRGETLIITERGTPIALLSPVDGIIPDGAMSLLETGLARWQQGKPKGAKDPHPVKGHRNLSAFVLEDRR